MPPKQVSFAIYFAFADSRGGDWCTVFCGHHAYCNYLERRQLRFASFLVNFYGRFFSFFAHNQRVYASVS
jgi:hypothetical protein